ncbi:MAG TPA: hypothetical protein VM409_08595, partial [Chloroflexia bacterium]|nr:hypothetical protein [Chloroflexia bacterium]
MSKQPTRKTTQGSRPVTTGGQGTQTTVVKPQSRSVQTGSSTARRGAAMPQKKAGFRLRPLDIALTLGLLAVVGFIIWGGLNPNTGTVASVPQLNNTTPVSQGNGAPNFTLPGTD